MRAPAMAACAVCEWRWRRGQGLWGSGFRGRGSWWAGRQFPPLWLHTNPPFSGAHQGGQELPRRPPPQEPPSPGYGRKAGANGIFLTSL